MAIDYNKGANESIDAYKARIAAAQTPVAPTIGADGRIQNVDTGSLGSSSVAAAGLDTNTTLQQLNAQAGAISSQGSLDELVSGFTSAIQGQKDAAAANQARLESAGTRESGYLMDKLTNERTSLLERSGGTSGNTQALMLVDKEIDKSMKDLEMRKNELILQGNEAAASKISELQVQQLTMKTDLQQKRFTNLLNLGQYAEQVNQRISTERQQSRAMTMDELKYNLDVNAQEISRANSEADRTYRTAQLAIMQGELKLKQVAAARESKLDNIAADAGWVDANHQMGIMAQIVPELTALASDKNLSTDELRASKAVLYAKYRHLYPSSIVSDSALQLSIFGPIDQPDVQTTTPYINPLSGNIENKTISLPYSELRQATPQFYTNYQ